MILTVEMGMAMAIGPITRISEAIACREYYAQHDPTKIGADGHVAEEFCKVKDVQTELAAVKGYMEFFDGLLSMFSSLEVIVEVVANLRSRCPSSNSLRSSSR